LDLLRVGFFGVASLRQFDDAVALLATFYVDSSQGLGVWI
jgi:hypothetical protein